MQSGKETKTMQTMTNKLTLHLRQQLPFAANVPIVELEPERIRCNDIVFPWESHLHGMRLWVVGNEYGALGAVWAGNEQDALDELVDSGLGDGLLCDEAYVAELTEAEREELSHLGNAGEWADLQHAWLAPVVFDKVKDFDLILAFAEARGACADNLDR